MGIEARREVTKVAFVDHLRSHAERVCSTCPKIRAALPILLRRQPVIDQPRRNLDGKSSAISKGAVIAYAANVRHLQQIPEPKFQAAEVHIGRVGARCER